MIREGSPIESFHSSDTQLETLSLRCDSPKSVISPADSAIDSAAATEPVQLPLTADLIEPAVHEPSELDTLLYDHGNALEMSFHNSSIDQLDESPVVSNGSSKNSSCELLHNSKPQPTDFRTMFGSSPLLNYSSVTNNSRCLDNMPLKYRRGYSNLNDACMSSSTSNIKDILRTNRCTNESLRTAIKSNTNTNNIGASSSNSISQEIFSFLRNQNNAPADYVRSYENLDRTKIIRIKNDAKRITGNTNYGYAEGDTIPSYSNRSQISSTSSINSQEWRYDKSFDDEMKEENDSTDYSYSNLAYDNADMSGPPAFWNTNQEPTYRSDDSLFNINFDATDDDVFQIDSMNLLGVADSPLQSDQSFFEDDDCASNRPKNRAIEKPDTAKQYPIFVEPPRMIALKKGDLLKMDMNRNRGNRRVQIRTKQLEFIAKCDQNEIEKPVILPPVKPMATTDAVSEAVQSPPVNPRCAQCNKKLGIIMVMKCHCEKIFCAKHRYAEAHNCSFDFKKDGQKTIAKENPLVVATKLTKI